MKFTCDNYFYQIYNNNGQLATLDTVAGTFSNIGFPMGFSVRAAGYNVVDSFAYGIRHNTNELIRIHADGTNANLGPVAFLTAGDFNAADFGPDSLLWVKKGGGSFVLQGININTLTVSKQLILSSAFNQADIVWVDTVGLWYSVEQLPGGFKQLISIDPNTGVVTSIGTPYLFGTIGAMFTDITGKVFGSANDGTGLYVFDQTTGAPTLIGNAPIAPENDGFTCPLTTLTCGDFQPPYIVGSVVLDTSIYLSDSSFQILLSEPIICSTVDLSGADFDLDCTGSTTITACNLNSFVSATPVNCVNDTSRYIELHLDDPTPAWYDNDWAVKVASSTGIIDTCSNLLNPNGQLGASGYAIILPLELLSFTVACLDENTTSIQWSTAVESEVTHFEMERSETGEEFRSIGLKRATGSNSDYTFMDQATIDKIVYYRLKIRYRDGTFSYSEVIGAESTCFDFQFFQFKPNPVEDQATVRFSLVTDHDIDLEIYNVMGQRVMQKQINGTSGINQISLGLEILQAGTYYLVMSPIRSSAERKMVRFLKK